MDIIAVLLGLLIVGLVGAFVNYPAVRIILGVVVLLIVIIVYIKRKRPAIRTEQLDSFLILAAHVIEADGNFQRPELDKIRGYLTRKLKKKNQVEQAMERLQEIRQEKYDIANACREVRSNFPMDEREQILRFLFGLAIASDDHKLQPSEDLAIAEISVQLGIDERTHQKIRELYSSPEEQEPPPPPEPPLPPENEKYRKDYEIIGLNPNATNKEVIKAWRFFNKQCHPDRQPPKKRAEAEKVYKEKIPSWDRIRKLRGLR